MKSGDTLSHIAQYTLGDSRRWREIYALNKDTVKNPNLIRPGQQLLLPEGSGGEAPRRQSGSSGSGGKRGSGGGRFVSGSGSAAGGASSAGNANGGTTTGGIIEDILSGGKDWVIGGSLVPTYNGAGDLVNGYR